MQDNTTDIRIAARHATPKGLVQLIDRKANGRRLQRIELRYSTCSTDGFSSSLSTQAISNLMREQGQRGVQISIRPLESPIEDALGEHRLRLLFQGETNDHANRDGAPNHDGWRHWLQRWGLARWVARRPQPSPATAPAAQAVHSGRTKVPAKDTTHARQSAPVASDAEAAALLQRAVLHARPLDETLNRNGSLGEAIVVVRVKGLDDPLRRMVAHPSTATWLSQRLKELGWLVDAPLAVRYTYEPMKPDQGTVLAGQGDVEVQLRTSRSGLDAADEATALPAWAGDCTALPVAEAAPAPLLRVRVLGDTRRRYVQALESTVALPARLDRALFERAGLGAVSPEALRVLSQSCPLMVQCTGQRELLLEPAKRQVGGPEPTGSDMYFHAQGGAPVKAQEVVSDGRVLIQVNGPHALKDPVTGKTIHPLLVELLLV